MGLFGFGKKKHQSEEALERPPKKTKRLLTQLKTLTKLRKSWRFRSLPLNTRPR